MSVCVCVCLYECVFDKGCVIYLSNVRISDNATPVSRLAETVVMTTLANNLSDLGSLSLREREVLETEEQRGVFFCSFVEWWLLIKNRTHVALYRGLMHLGLKLERDGKQWREKKSD